MISADSAHAATPPAPAVRSVAWLLLTATAAAVGGIGIVATVSIVAALQPRLEPAPLAFWLALAFAVFATCASLGLRTIVWIFLLRRSGVRIPLRDACIGYLSGFSLLFVPLLAGEIAVRAHVLRWRAAVPPATTCFVVLWERVLDIVALALLAGVAALWLGTPQIAIVPITLVVLTSIGPLRRLLVHAMMAASNVVARTFAPDQPPTAPTSVVAVAEPVVWSSALATTVAAWVLPAAALWVVASSWGGVFGIAHAQFAYAWSALSGGFRLAPGGIRVVGAALITDLQGNGLSEANAAVTVLAIRLSTAGLATILGGIFVWLHVRTSPLASASHFDDIAHAYDAQIPPAQREALLTRKTALMRQVIEARGVGRGGLDVGCGQGWYVARMRQLGFDVRGIDASARQIALARRHVDDPSVIVEGSALRIDARDASYDFLYTINVLHHLASFEEQRAAFAELLRVVRPGGLLFVHEINTRNLLFRFYMGYVFPTLNCIDEGTERWLLPHQLSRYTSAPVVATEYFTFLPEFVPASVLATCRPIEAALERSPLRVFSAHYMAVLQKPAATT